MQLVIDVPTGHPKDIARDLRSLASQFDPIEIKFAKTAPPPQVDESPEDHQVEAEAPAKRGRGRPAGATSAPKAAPVAAAPDLADFEGTTPPQDGPEPTEEDVRTAVTAYFNVHGKEKTFEILKRFQAARIGDLKPREYSIVISTLAAAGRK